MTKTSALHRLMSAVIVALSLSLLWAVVLGWGGSIVQHWIAQPTTRESLHVTADGTPLIQVVRSNDWNNADFLTLDREPVSAEVGSTLSAAYRYAPYREPGVLPMPMAWTDRVGGMSSASKPYTSWYFVRNAERPGKAYFIGYDSASKLPVAYASQSGVGPNPPLESDWFDVGADNPHGGVVASAGGFYWRQAVTWHGVATDEGAINTWNAYLVDGDRVVELDARNRRLRTLAPVPGVQAVGILSEPLPLTEGGAEQDEPAAEADGASVPTGTLPITPIAFYQGNAFLTFTPAINSRRKTKSRLAAFSDTEILLIDPKTDNIERFPLPEELRDDVMLAVYSLGEGRLLVHKEPWSWRTTTETPSELYWLGADGEIEQQRTLDLSEWRQPDPQEMLWVMTGFGPEPVAWLVGWTIGAPLIMLQEHDESTYAAALSRATEEAWPQLITVLLVGVALAAVAWSKHRRLYREHRFLWSGMVFLFGPMGLVAYWLHWRRPASDHCPSCDRHAPRDREHCPACQAEWPTPSLLGTEVFA